MDLRLTIIAVVGLSIGVTAQPSTSWSILQSYTLAGKPAFGVRNRTVYITDCESTSACTVGGGSTIWLFRDSGTSWAASHPAGGGGSGLGDPGANGIVVRTALNTTVNRTITANSTKVSIGNGDGVAANPTVDVTEANLTLSALGGSVTDAQVPNTITVDLAAAATALAADPTDCSANQPSIGINASGTANCNTLTAALLKSTTGVRSAATAQDVSGVQYVAGGGTAQAQTATLAPAITAQANGQKVCWLPLAANTAAAPTLAVNGLTATTITKLGTTALVANDLTTTAVACAILVGANYQLQNPQTVAAGSGDVVGPASSIGTNLASFNGTTGKLIADSGIEAATVVKGAASLTTVGAIPYVSAAGTLNQDSLLLWDATNNRISIGTTNTDHTVNLTDADYIGWTNNGIKITGAGGLGFGVQVNNNWALVAALTTRNVLVGTATDSNFKLDVANSGSSGTFRAYDQTATTGTTKAVFRDGAGQTGNLIEAQNNAGTALWAIGGGVPRWGDVAEPTCNSTNRGALVMDQGGAAVLDTFRVCRKDAADAYAYVPLMNEGLTVAQGGTGAVTLTGLLQGNGTGAITGISDSSTVGQTLRVTGASTYAWGAINLASANAVTGILPGANGGTNNGFMDFTGPATSLKTYTLPNASTTILTTNALVTGAQGGTNNGFFDVTGPATSLKTFTFPNASATVLTTNAAVTVAQGGSGAATLTGILKGNGTSAFTAATVGTDYGTPDATAKTFTNTTYDAAATGNVLTVTDRVYFTAAGCNNATATTAFDLPTTGAATAVCIGTTTTTGLMDFADAATQSGSVHWVLPSDWSGTIDVILRYGGSTSSANNIRWQVSTACVADDQDLIAPSYNAASATNSAGPTTAGQRKSVTFSSVAVTNCAASETMFLKVERVGADAGDTYTGTGRLMSAAINYTRAM